MEDLKPYKQFVSWTKIGVVILFTVLLLYVLVGIKLPYNFKMPGKCISASDIVYVKGGKPHRGRFYIPTVISERSNILLYIYHFIDNRSRLIPIASGLENKTKKMIAESNSDPNDIYLNEVIYRAKLFALRKVGHKIPVEPNGVQVARIVPGSMAEKNLRPGDIIIGIDKTKILHQLEIYQYMNKISPRKPYYTITFIRKGKILKRIIPPDVDVSGSYFLGAYLVTHLKRYKLPVNIRIDTDQFTGPSAGLSIFLEIVNQLTKDDISYGKSISCSGSLSSFGAILPVKGIQFKVLSSEKADCRYFFCHPSNSKTAMRYSSFIRVIQVKSIDGSLLELKKIGEKIKKVKELRNKKKSEKKRKYPFDIE